MASDLSTKLAQKDILGRGLSKNDFSDKKMFGLARASQRISGRVLAFMGDSITEGAGSSGGFSFVNLVKRLVGSATISDASINAGVGGETSTQILARYDSIVRNRIDGVVISGVVFAGGLNDVIQNVPLSTFAANIKTLHRKTVEDGITLIICNVTPLGTTNPTVPTPTVSTAANRALTLLYNNFTRLYCFMNGIGYADVHSALVLKSGASSGQIDPLYISGGSDNVHPVNYGHYAEAGPIAAVINSLFSAPHLVDHVAGANTNIGTNLVANPIMATDTLSWMEQAGGTGSAATLSAVSDSTGKLKAGRWLQADWNATTGGSKNIRTSSITFSVNGVNAGDKLLITARRDFEDIEGNYEFNATPASKPCAFGLYVMDSSFVQRDILDDGAIGKPGPVMKIFTVPVGMTGLIISMFIKLNSGRNVRFKIGEVGVFNITGMTDIIDLL